MSQRTTAPFDAQFPYRLSETDMDRLMQAQGLLTALSQLAGQAGMADKTKQPEFTSYELHLALWAVEEAITTVVEHALKPKQTNA